MKKIIVSLIALTSAHSVAQTKTDTTKTQTIQEVKMTKKVFQRKSDRFVYDVASTPVAKGNTAFGLLKETPLVSSTDDKTLQIAGKGNAIIYLNGRPTQMDADALEQFLKNTPGENIQKIEVITTPGSEYRLESSDGIINIVLKKKSSDGLNGNFRMFNKQNYYNSTGASTSLNYRKGKLGINGSINTSENIEQQFYELENGNAQAATRTQGFITDPNKNLGGYLNIDYELNDRSYLALSYNSWANRSYGATSSLFNMDKNLVDNTTRYTWTDNNEDTRSYNNSLNLNYELKIDSLGSKLNLNVAGLLYRRFQVSDNITTAADATGNRFGRLRLIEQDQPQYIDNFSTTADYIKKFKKDFTASVGLNYNKTKTDNDTKYLAYNYMLGTEQDNPNHFVYDENIAGAYLTLEKVFSPKFSGKLGSRLEYTQSVGTSDNAQDESLRKITQEYYKVLPSVSFNYSINDQNNVSYAFSSRMRRPRFWELNPVRHILTENNYIQNDPFVKASSIYSHEFTYMYRNAYFLILQHSLVKDKITQVPLQGVINGKNQLRYIRTNFGDTQEMSAMLGTKKSFFKGIWTLGLNAGVQHNINKGSLNRDPLTGDIFPMYENYRESTSFVLQTNHNIQLDKKKTWYLGANYFYVDKQQIDLGQLESLMQLDLNIKKIWENWTFSLEATDVLNTFKTNIYDVQDNGNYNIIRQNQYRRGLQFTVVYNFGNQKVKRIRKIDSAADDIKSRTN